MISALAGSDWRQVERAATEAMDIAKRFGDVDFEILALAYGGLAALSLGRTREGMATLDEAMTAVTAGEMVSPEWIGQVYCAIFAGCERTIDSKRADQWIRVAHDYLGRHDHAPMTATCRASYGAVLTATGRWTDAERELRDSLRNFEAGHRWRWSRWRTFATAQRRGQRLETVVRESPLAKHGDTGQNGGSEPSPATRLRRGSKSSQIVVAGAAVPVPAESSVSPSALPS